MVGKAVTIEFTAFEPKTFLSKQYTCVLLLSQKNIGIFEKFERCTTNNHSLIQIGENVLDLFLASQLEVRGQLSIFDFA